MLTSVNADNVNNTGIHTEDNIIQTDNASMVHVTSNISKNNVTRDHTVTVNKNKHLNKNLKQESHEGYVYVNSNGIGDGSDSTTPANITYALTKVTNGGTIYLVTDEDNDTYYFNTRININSNTLRNFNITAQQGKTITFIGNSTIWIYQGHTINITGITFTDGKGGNGGVIMNGGNLTINNSTFINNTADNGGAIYNDRGNLTITNSIFINNTATNGTIYSNVGNIILNNNTFTNNIVRTGGVISGNKCNTTIINNLFMNNSAEYGGAICLTHNYNSAYTYYSINKVINNTFTSNKATYGGAIYSFGTDDTINNNIFINNTADNHGGAILNSISNQTIKNNTFTNNNAEQGGAIYSIQGNQNITGNTFTNNIAIDNSNSLYSYYTNQALINNTLPSNTVIIKGNIIEENKDRIVYNQRDVVPTNTSEKNYTVENNPNLYTAIVFPLRDGQPVPFNDNSTSFCTELHDKIPVFHAIYERQIITNQTVINTRMNKNVIEYVKAFLVLFWNDSSVFEDASNHNVNRVVIDFLTAYNIYDPVTLAYTPNGLKKPLQYFLTSIEEALEQNNGTISNRGLLRDNVTTYQLYYYKALDAYNGGIHYQNMIGINLNKTPLEMSWAWKLVNQTTTENITENYTVNTTVQEPYNATEEYQENITVQEPYNVTETYNVNITKQVPYNTTETYIVNVTRHVPYTITENYTRNITKNTSHSTGRASVIRPYIPIKTVGIGRNTIINNNVKQNIKTQPVKVTTQETRTRTVTKYRNVTTQETRTRTVTEYRNVTTQEIKNITVTKYRNMTKTVTRTRIVTKYRPVTHEEQRSQTITQINYNYKLYIYLLYLEGKISYKDLVAIVRAENIQFNEQGQIELTFNNIEDIPADITVKSSDNSDIPTTSDNIDTSNPDGLEEPVMDAGIITTEI
jgi:predicted outer membrane repeat protein